MNYRKSGFKTNPLSVLSWLLVGVVLYFIIVKGKSITKMIGDLFNLPDLLSNDGNEQGQQDAAASNEVIKQVKQENQNTGLGSPNSTHLSIANSIAEYMNTRSAGVWRLDSTLPKEAQEKIIRQYMTQKAADRRMIFTAYGTKKMYNRQWSYFIGTLVQNTEGDLRNHVERWFSGKAKDVMLMLIDTGLGHNTAYSKMNLLPYKYET